MARGWTCARCSTKNGEGTMNCAKCGLIVGGVVVQPSPPPLDMSAAPAPPPPVSQDVEAPLHAWGSGSNAGWVLPASAAEGPTRPLWRRIPLQFILFGAFALAGGVGAFMTDAIRLPMGIAKSGEMDSGDLQVGDCWDLQDRFAETFETVIARPCTEAHEYEVFYLDAMPAGDYPTDDAFEDFIVSTCVSPFQTYVGKPYADSSLDISWSVPTIEAWSQGSRVVNCSIEDPGNSRLTTSLHSSHR
jgi:hypothetical protein